MLEHLNPSGVFKFFEAISQIPRGSGNEKAISDYMVAFAKSRNLWVHQDESLNVIIKKPGTKGYENAPICIIQGHLDMVNEKNMVTIHDFEKDPIKLQIDGDLVKACGTTLGADNGLGVAYAMELLDRSDIPHPPLEVVMTTGEEIGLLGAAVLDEKLLDGKMLINIDSEEEGIFWVSCAGGVTTHTTLEKETTSLPAGYEAFKIMISGLKGGHSGNDIDKERGNSIKLMGRILIELNKCDFYLADINGGSKDNAIPRECVAVVYLSKSDTDKFTTLIDATKKSFQYEFRTSDSGISLTCEKTEQSFKHVFAKSFTDKIITAINLIPNGILAMSQDIEGLVETSNNIGVIVTDETKTVMRGAARSSVSARKAHLKNLIRLAAEAAGGNFETTGEYPAWEYAQQSKLRGVFKEAYEEIYGKEARFAAIHAGLECGFFAEKMPGLDIISLGPDLYDIHTPDERMSISSIKRTWELLLNVLARIK